MNVEITEFEKMYEFELIPVTQLCGQNIQKKSYIFESIRRYFGTYKYSEEKNKWRDNILIDGKSVGRKYFSVISIKQISDVLQMIKWSKQSLMMEYVKNLMQKFDWQLHLRAVSEEVEEMFQLINDDIGHLGDIELSYSLADVWDMVQKSEISGRNETDLNDKSNNDLIVILLNLVDEVMAVCPKRMMIIFENIDHMIDKREYVALLEMAQNIARKYGIYFLFSTSLEGYVCCDDELCPGIAVFGDIDFQMPAFPNVCEFVRDNYPCVKDISDLRIQTIVSRIIQKIGQQEYLYSIEESVVCKLINESLLIQDKLEDEKLPELAFLKA